MKKYFIAVLISMVSVFGYAAEEPKYKGWTALQDDQLITYEIENTGNKDGKLVIGCKRKVIHLLLNTFSMVRK